MTDTTTTATTAKPRITLLARDYARLSALANAAMNTMPDIAAELADELDRADVLAEGQHAEHTVCMGSRVTFTDETTGRTQTVTLVYPQDADIAQGRVSVLTPIGTALIGLRAGAAITWETRSGETRRLTVRAVEPPAG